MNQYELNRQMFEAARSGKIDRIWELVELGADINAGYESEDDEDDYMGGKTALIFLAEKRKITPKCLDTFISHGADINAKDYWGDTALIVAAKKGYLTPELLEAFINHSEAQRNASQTKGRRDSEVHSSLLLRRRNPSPQGGRRDGADINVQDENGNTALIESALRGFLTPELLGAFISHGADIHARDEYGCTALIWSARRGHLTQELARAFVEQFIRLGTPLEEIQKQLPASKETPAILVPVLIDKLESEPGLVVDFMKKHVGKKLQEWVDNGVEGADILVSRLAHQIRQKEFMSEGSGTQNMDFF